MILTTTLSKNISIIITAAGSSTRIGCGIKKEYIPFQNGTVLSTCVKTFLNTLSKSYKISNIIVTTPVNGIEESKKAVYTDTEISELEKHLKLTIQFVEGGNTRQSSVYNGLNKIFQSSSPCDFVLIHDGARPFVSENIILNSLKASIDFGASVPGISPTDTQKQISKDGFIEKHLERNLLVSVQTPQCFEFSKLFHAHKKAISDNKEYTDDTEIWGKYCGPVKVVPGDANNIKITYPSDLEKLKIWLELA